MYVCIINIADVYYAIFRYLLAVKFRGNDEDMKRTDFSRSLIINSYKMCQKG